MRDFLISEVYRLEEVTGLSSFEDFRTWSNKDLLQRYGDLRIEHQYIMDEQNEQGSIST